MAKKGGENSTPLGIAAVPSAICTQKQFKISENLMAKKEIYDSAGDRTQNLWFRRPAPYPLGHGVLDAVGAVKFIL